MIRYRGHIVYVVTTLYPAIASLSAIARPATRRDLELPLGVISEGRCVPLSEYEAGDLRARLGS